MATDRTATETHLCTEKDRILILDCTLDSTDGSYASRALTTKIGGTLKQLITKHTATTPSASWACTLTNARTTSDVLLGRATGLSSAVSQVIPLEFSIMAQPKVLDTDTLSLAITGNTVNSSIIQLALYYRAD